MPAPRSRKNTPKAELETAAKQTPQEGEGMQHPAAVVMRVPAEDGNERIEIATLNGLDTLAVPLLLKLAIKAHEKNFGLED